MGALERAKMAVEKHYAVVGVLEDVNSTLTVLENYIPRFFRGATDVYYGNSFVPLFAYNCKSQSTDNYHRTKRALYMSSIKER